MGRPRIRYRMSSLAAVFVQAIIPRKVDKDAQAELYKRFGISPEHCIYCGSPSTDEDHLHPIVKEGRPSGYFHTKENILPARGTCNQSKSGADWRSWIEGNAAKSPNAAGIAERITRIAAFAKTVENPIIAPGEMRRVVGPELWDRYWRRLDEIGKLMDDAQADADEICAALASEFETRVSAATRAAKGTDSEAWFGLAATFLRRIGSIVETGLRRSREPASNSDGP
jgi:hypothetical protein